MNSELQSIIDAQVAERAVDDETLSDGATYLVMAALEGDSALREQVDQRMPRSAQSVAAATATAPKRAFLNSLQVTGFRGIGKTASLPLSPQPGLTIVSGRNGSGKSSFVEALETAVTGRSYRFDDKTSTQWESAWRNKHSDEAPAVRVEMSVEDEGPTLIGLDWTADADRTGYSMWAQPPGQKRQQGKDPLGWAEPLQLYRPILTYDEIGNILAAKPSELYDSLARVVGLDSLADTVKRIEVLHKELKVHRVDANAKRKKLREFLATVDDERSKQADDILRKTKNRDLDALSALAAGASEPSPVLAALQAISDIVPPTSDSCTDACAELADATAQYTAALEEDNQLVRERIELLKAALTYRERTDDETCPVCGEGQLDGDWKTHADELIAQSDGADPVAEPRRRMESAQKSVNQIAAQLIPIYPVDGVTIDGLHEYAMLQAAKPSTATAADAAWLQSSAAALTAVAASARDELAARHDAWRPAALLLAEWITVEQQASESDQAVEDLDTARKWLQATINELRNQRIAPIADQARRIWADLRQESNVDLEDVRLEGANTSRKVRLVATVDGEEDSALAVMSQGELHALSLALFLPRAMMPESPFRFLILDDPIQAMDPSKVDAFVRVLTAMAKTRQVIVFSHDDRLPNAVRQLGVSATILEISRAKGSVVTIDSIDNPATRYLSDARALLKDDAVPMDVKGRTVGALARFAIEAAAQQAFYAVNYGEGLSRGELEDRWEKANATRAKVALAVSNAKDPDGKSWLGVDGRGAVISKMNALAHQGGTVAIEDLRPVERMAKTLLAMK